VKRKLHALTLLLLVLQKSGNFFRASPGAAFLLRRVVCPALITSALTDVPSIFRLNMTIFLELWQNYKEMLMVELGGFLDFVYLGLLESPHPTHEQKKDILELFVHILSTSSSLVNLYYNYDNAASHAPPLFEKLTASVGRIIEGACPPSPLHLRSG
jgi:Sec7-like guanine-nucleotide exchange factor